MKQSQSLAAAIASLSFGTLRERDALRTLHFITLAMTKYVFRHLEMLPLKKPSSRYQTHPTLCPFAQIINFGSAEKIVKISKVQNYYCQRR